MLWWSPPKQRQRWGDSQILPGGNWGQIFFDLFYVGGAYNLGNVLKSSNNGRGILYFCGAGFPVMMMWFDKMYYDARFTTRPGHDAVHRMLEVLQICFVATALSRIRSVEIMSHTCEHVDMFQFSLSLFLNSMITIFRYLEVVYHVIGDPAAKVAAKRDIKWRLIPTLLLLAATIESGYFYFSNAWCNGNNRPIWYCLASWMSWALIGYCDQVVFAPKQRCAEISVPINVHFCMHRYGEWFMLMFGESVISLLIVDGNNEAVNYSIAFYSGIFSVIFLAHLHYGSEPHKANSHALSRSRHSNYVYTIMVPIYSAALIAIGVSYKMFLYESSYKYGGDNSHRTLGGGETTTYDDDDGDDDGGYQEKRQQFAADLFSGSIATVLVCADLMQLLHKGLHKILERARTVSKTSLTVFVTLKYSLIVLLGTLSTFQNDPHVMAFCGLGAILFQEFLRNFFFRAKPPGDDCAKDGKVDHDENKFNDDATWYSAGSDGSQDDEKSVLAIFEQQEILHRNSKSVIDESESLGTVESEDQISRELDYSRLAEF
jgi:hypothetical protein